MTNTTHEYDVPDYGDVFTLQEFKDAVYNDGLFTDYDGIGQEAWLREDGTLMMSSLVVSPSTLKNISNKATHVVWFNR